MKTNQEAGGRIMDHTQGAGVATPEQVEERAREIAVINGRSANKFNEADVEQAKRELLGAPDASAMEEEGWEQAQSASGEATAGGIGKRAETLEPADEQTFAEKLTHEGVDEAEHDSMVESAKEQRKRV